MLNKILLGAACLIYSGVSSCIDDLLSFGQEYRVRLRYRNYSKKLNKKPNNYELKMLVKENERLVDKYNMNLFSTYFKRIAAIGVMALCAAAFVGSLALPIPGLTPLTTLGLLPILKACGIGIGYTIAARTIASTLGALGDYVRFRRNYSPFYEILLEQRKGVGWNFFKDGVSSGIFGEFGDNIWAHYTKKWEMESIPKKDAAEGNQSVAYGVVLSDSSSSRISSQLEKQNGQECEEKGEVYVGARALFRRARDAIAGPTVPEQKTRRSMSFSSSSDDD